MACSGDDGETVELTCAFVTAEDNCFRTLATRMIDCMDVAAGARLVTGDFDAAATVCTDASDPERTATFNPPRPTDSLVGNWYTGSFTLRNGASECGTFGYQFEGHSAIVITVNGETAVFSSAPYYEYVCPDGNRYTTEGGGNVGACTSQLPGTNGAVNFQTNGRLGLSNPDQPMIDCSLLDP